MHLYRVTEKANDYVVDGNQHQHLASYVVWLLHGCCRRHGNSGSNVTHTTCA